MGAALETVLRALRTGATADLNALADVTQDLRQVTCADLAADALRVIATMDDIDHLLDDCYEHPNGFTRIALPVPAGLGRARLHVFSSGKESDLHNHRWPYVSVVLRGTLSEEVYAVGPGADGTELWWHRHSQSPDRASFSLTPGERTQVHRTAVIRRSAGHVLAVDRTALHRVTPLTSSAVTLLLEGGQTRQDSDVYASAPRPLAESRSPRHDRDTLLVLLRSLDVASAADP